MSLRRFNYSSDILNHCITQNLEFSIAVLDHMLNLFCCNFYSFHLCIRESSFLPHQLGWVERDINDYWGVANFNQQYLHKAHKVLDRVNTGVFIMERGVLAFLAKCWGGHWVIERIMKGLSIVVNQFLKVHIHLPKSHKPPITFVCDQVTRASDEHCMGSFNSSIWPCDLWYQPASFWHFIIHHSHTGG